MKRAPRPRTPLRQEVIDLLETVHDVCGRLEPGNVPLHAAPQVFDALASAERLIAGAVLRMAGRDEEAGEWTRNGGKSAGVPPPTDASTTESTQAELFTLGD